MSIIAYAFENKLSTKYKLENNKMRRHINNNIFIYFMCDMFHYKFNFE